GPTMVVRAAGAPAVLYEGAYHKNKAADLFSDAKILDAQRYLVREVVGYFKSHPALWAWQIGEGVERIHRPRSAQAVYEWYAALPEAVHEQDFRARLLGVTSARGLTLHAGPRPEDLAATCNLVGVAADPPEPPSGDRPNHSAYVAYLHALTAALGRAPALV